VHCLQLALLSVSIPEFPMKLTLHPGSAIAGAALLALPFVLASFQADVAWPRQVPIPVSVQELPDPHNMIVIREEDGPYVVPPQKLLVLTGLGSQGEWDEEVILYVDGIQEMTKRCLYPGGGIPASSSIASLPPGFTVLAGKTVTMDSPSLLQCRAWGYLVDA